MKKIIPFTPWYLKWVKSYKGPPMISKEVNAVLEQLHGIPQPFATAPKRVKPFLRSALLFRNRHKVAIRKFNKTLTKIK